MNRYEESPLFSGRKGAVFIAVILLHIVFGIALYRELTARIGTLEASPLNLARISRTIKQTIELPRGVPLMDQVRIHVTPPELPPVTPLPEPVVRANSLPIDPRPTIAQVTPHPGVTRDIRVDPSHPLRISETYYPDASRRANEMGRCLVKVTVRSDGRIIAAAIQSSTGFERLDQACLNAVKGQRMLPALEDGKAVESTTSIPIVWNLSDR